MAPASTATTPKSNKRKASSTVTPSPAATSNKKAKKKVVVTAGVIDECASAAVKNGGTVYEDYNVMMNQTNLGANNNKFYKIQLIEMSDGRYVLFTKWGRVGETGKTQEQGPMKDLNQAMKEFAKKFKSKSGNAWDKYQDDKDSFVSKKGKYTVVEMEEDNEAAAAMEEKAAAASAANGETTVVQKKKKKAQKPIAPSALDPSTKSLVDLIFNHDMFQSAMADMNLDPRKLPLGALSQTQLKKGYAILERLEDAIDNHAGHSTYQDITSEFYTIIPHAFGRRVGPVLTTKEKVQEKFDMLNTLSDIETAQAMQKKSEEKEKQEEKEDDDGETHRPNPSDVNYEQLLTDLTLLDNPTKDADMKWITKYFNDTKSDYCHMKLDKVWRVNRHDEDKRFAEHEDLKERKLLWHGTSVAVVAAILKSGLRIMPHSGGRVGKGIYLADQHQKSAGYTGCAQGKMIMFLVEAALGNIHQIQRDDSSLVAAPAGHHSVLARGQTQPPTVKEIDIDGKVVKVPQGKPKDVKEAKGSSFWHNEFLLYKESQHRIRYILCFDSQ